MEKTMVNVNLDWIEETGAAGAAKHISDAWPKSQIN
jgi:hypothetical protein